jgi:hypothetical protein
MVTSANCEGSLRLPDAMVLAIARHAEREADLTAAFLRATGLYESEPPKLPAAFLLELAAVLELGLWERRDLRRHLDVDLPTNRQAADQLAARCAKGPKEFDGPNAAPLSRQVLRVWVERFAWDGRELLAAEVVLGDVNEDDFIDLLAGFVWEHRRELAHLIRGEEQK